MKHLLKMLDLSKEEILDILNLADQLKYENKNGIEHHILKGKTLGMIFQKSSTRTRVSFETGMYQLGGQALFLSNRDLQIGRGEPVQDTARVLSRYLDGIMIRTFEQKEVEDLAKYGSIPVINGLTDFCHPCQVLADLMTIREFKGRFEGLKMCYIGDGNNMANSLIVGGLKVGMEVSIACPKDYQPAAEVLEFAKGYGDKFSMTDVPLEAAKNADVLFTDVWTSMGEEAETEKRKIAFKGYQINDDIMAVAKADAMVQHCLPAHREEEITEKVFEAHANEIFEEAENRLHAQKAVMVKVMGPEE
ncbi:ornithine carbamoyltransferase [Ruminococcus sp.]|uniref:ornithine carbamoyltransferase n=1 Tax=Ruminococcus sp. TaxID=41978 RepID=UPI003AB526D3